MPEPARPGAAPAAAASVCCPMRQQQELPALLTPAEVCAALRISRATLYRMVARQDIEVVRLGRGSGSTLRVPVRELERLLGTASAGSSGTTNPKEAA